MMSDGMIAVTEARGTELIVNLPTLVLTYKIKIMMNMMMMMIIVMSMMIMMMGMMRMMIKHDDYEYDDGDEGDCRDRRWT
jgi:hypothetical protein